MNRQTASFEKYPLSRKEIETLTGMEKFQFTRHIDGSFSCGYRPESPTMELAKAAFREAGYLLKLVNNRNTDWRTKGYAYRIPEWNFSGLLEAFEDAADWEAFNQYGKVYTEPNDVDGETIRLLQEIGIGANGLRTVGGLVYWVTSEPFLQYVKPIGPEKDAAVKLVDVQPGRNLDIAYSLYKDGKRYWVYAVAEMPGDTDMIAALVGTGLYGNYEMVILTNLSADTLVWVDAKETKPAFVTEIRLSGGWNGNWELNAEVHPEPTRHSSIRVSYGRRYGSQSEATTDIGWYSTTGDIEYATQFYDAYGQALTWAHRFETVTIR